MYNDGEGLNGILNRSPWRRDMSVDELLSAASQLPPEERLRLSDLLRDTVARKSGPVSPMIGEAGSQLASMTAPTADE